MPTRNNTTNHQAFALINLLVVLSIIPLLIAILLPALSPARDSAKSIQYASQERWIQISLPSYTYANDGYAEISWRPIRDCWRNDGDIRLANNA